MRRVDRKHAATDAGVDRPADCSAPRQSAALARDFAGAEMPNRRRELDGKVRSPWLHPRDRLPCERKMTRGEGHEP